MRTSFRCRISRIINGFKPIDFDVLAAYQCKMPRNIEVLVKKYDGVFVATIKKIDDEDIKDSLLITQADTEKELIEMVNDLITTHIDIPATLADKMPLLLPANFTSSPNLKISKNQIFIRA